MLLLNKITIAREMIKSEYIKENAEKNFDNVVGNHLSYDNNSGASFLFDNRQRRRTCTKS